ncbi:MAG: gamma-glutamylcyclotransferase [Planctomycetales bacterium]|nr:gamma-glutamylcyclotransferase [Planctomycetales bacterium]
MNLFAYGTLMFPEIWRRVVHRDFASAPALLYGYRIGRVRGEHYPAITRAPSFCRVRGIIYFDLDEQAQVRLDAYESDFYDRIRVRATQDNGVEIECDAYVLASSEADSHLEGPWRPEWFERESLEDYLHRLE